MVNLVLEREHLQESEEDLQGGWHTEGSLKLLPGWDTYLDCIIICNIYHICMFSFITIYHI